jgi:hypothetical protein
MSEELSGDGACTCPPMTAVHSLICTSEYIANSPRVIGHPRLLMDIAVELRFFVGQEWEWTVPAERLGDWMGTGGRSLVMARRRRGGLADWLRTVPARLSAPLAKSVARIPPGQRAGYLGRRKGASRPFGIGLRPTLPPTSGSRMGAGCGKRGGVRTARPAGLVSTRTTKTSPWRLRLCG